VFVYIINGANKFADDCSYLVVGYADAVAIIICSVVCVCIDCVVVGCAVVVCVGVSVVVGNLSNVGVRVVVITDLIFVFSFVLAFRDVAGVVVVNDVDVFIIIVAVTVVVDAYIMYAITAHTHAYNEYTLYDWYCI